MGEVQFIKTDGEELVVLSRRDYDSLLARSGDPEAEDAMTLRIAAEQTGKTALPSPIWDRIEAGEPAVAVLMQHRGLTAAALEDRSGLRPAVIADLVAGGEPPAGDALRRLCAALEVSPDVFEG